METDSGEEESAKWLHLNFNKEILARSQSKDLMAALAELKYESTDDSGEKWEALEVRCICGKRIRYVYNFVNQFTKNGAQVGSCCMKRLGINIDFSTQIRYLTSAGYLAKDERSKKFVGDLIQQFTNYKKRFKITSKQQHWLESITGQEWKWRNIRLSHAHSHVPIFIIDNKNLESDQVAQ